jgi:uncharacterized protein (TIGR00255 family)
MIMSMTGYGAAGAMVRPVGKINVELRSTNHKYCEIVLHVPEGFMSLEDKIKKIIEARIKRGRVVCAITIQHRTPTKVVINKQLLDTYLHALKDIRAHSGVQDDISLNTLVNLPGVLALEDNSNTVAGIGTHALTLVEKAVSRIAAMRHKEGNALQKYVRQRAQTLKKDVDYVRSRYKRVIQEKLTQLRTDEEKSSFLKNSDVTEEMDRLAFHIENLISKLSKLGPVGKELDFVAQEMQREANTTGAKSFDATVSGRVVEIKSQIEKIREQVQNIE